MRKPSAEEVIERLTYELDALKEEVKFLKAQVARWKRLATGKLEKEIDDENSREVLR